MEPITRWTAPKFFDPIIEEPFNWLELQAEIFFSSKDIDSYEVCDKTPTGEPILKSTESIAFGRFLTTTKIILYIFTFCLVPLVLLIAKCVYRLRNKFRISNPDYFRKITETELLKKVDIIGDLSKAKVIFLGDTHTDPNHKAIRTECFKYMQRFFPVKSPKPQAFLLEATPKVGEPDFFQPGLPHLARHIDVDSSLYERGKLTISGWEDMAKYDAHLNSVSAHFFLLFELIKLNEIDGVDITPDSPEDPLNPPNPAKLEIIEQLRSLQNKMNEQFMTRNEAMISAAKKAAEVSSRVFVIAGSEHLKKDALNDDIISYLKQKSSSFECAVIIPKNTKHNTKEEFLKQKEKDFKYIEKLIAQSKTTKTMDGIDLPSDADITRMRQYFLQECLEDSKD
jgi:hypothetical protein